MAGITTHVLNTVTGKPGTGMRIDFSVFEDGRFRLVKTIEANQDGRTDKPVLTPEETKVGHYELNFHVGEFFAKQGVQLTAPAFIDEVPVRFSIFNVQQHYHVPMLCTPWSCTTYRGS